MNTREKGKRGERQWRDQLREAVTNSVVLEVEVPVVSVGAGGVTVTNLVALPAVDAGIRAAGSVVDLLLPGIGSLAALALGGVYHTYCQARNKKVSAALVQGMETAREVLATTPQGQALDAGLVKWLRDNQKAAGVIGAVAGLVDDVTDNPAAVVAEQEIAREVAAASGAGVK